MLLRRSLSLAARHSLGAGRHSGRTGALHLLAPVGARFAVAPPALLPCAQMLVPQQRRWLSAKAGDSTRGSAPLTEDPPDPTLAAAKKKQLQLYNAGMIGAGGVVVYGISAGVHKVVSTFMGLNFTTVAWVGWAGGFVSASLCAAAAYSLKKAVQIRPQLAFYHCMDLIKASALAESVLGTSITTGQEELRAYRVDGGHFSVDDSMKPVWLPPRCQMLFQVRGSNEVDALASVECVKEGGRLVVNLLCLDVCNASEDVLFIEGKEERMHVKDQLRGFVDFKEKHQPGAK